MASKPTLLFLHGVGTGDLKDDWRVALDASLTNVGYPDLEEARVIAPKYPNTLKGSDDDEPLPPLTIKTLKGDVAKRHRRAFERRMSGLESLLGRHDAGDEWILGDAVANAALTTKKFIAASNYVSNARIRAQVLHRVLSVLPSSGRLVIVGHSLGSIIATDLLRRLPTDLEVTGMITLGSPLAAQQFHVEKIRSTLASPPSNLAWWVNFWNVLDPVTTHKGVSSMFPWMIDRRVRTPLGLDVHEAVTYLSNDIAATAVGFALFGSQSRTLMAADKGLDIPLDYAETVALMALRFAHLTAAQLDDDKADRYLGALRQVQATTVDLVKQRNATQGRPLPTAIAQASVDLTDPESSPVIPPPITSLSKEDALVPLVSIAAANVLRPFEIEVPKVKRERALRELTLEMGLGSQLGVDVFRAADRTRDVLKGGTNWVKWVALGLGAAAVVAATGGLALAAAPGVAGAAAVTSALAAFGPGGMIGGLLTAGTLVSAGGGGIAIGLASPSTTAATLEAVVGTQLTGAILRDLQGFDQDPTTWNALVETGIELRREGARLEALSDESSPSLKELHLKLEMVDRALSYLDEHGLRPSDDSDDPEDIGL